MTDEQKQRVQDLLYSCKGRDELCERIVLLEDENGELREQIVRCRDCKHYADHEWVIATDVSDVCHFWANGVKVEPDGFCKWGERRADA